MANSGLPATSGFVGEFLIILASFKVNFWIAFAAATIMILGAAYTLWMVKRVFYGAVANEGVAALKDINGRETFMLATLAIMVLFFGIYPAPMLDVMHSTVEHLVQHIGISKIPN